MQYDPMLEVPDRITQLRRELFETPDSVCFERAGIVTRVYQQTEGQHSALRRAKALQAVFAEMPIFIREGELIVGQRATHLGARAVYPEFHLNGLSAETTPPDIWNYWHGRTLGDEVHNAYPERLRLAENELAAGFCTGADSGFGHVIVDYEKVLRRGFRDIAAEASRLLAETPQQDIEGRAFLEGVEIAIDGILKWAQRYADLAEEQARVHPDPARRAELSRIADICRRVPAEPARDFHEALQSFWFTHLALHIEQYGWSISAGRFDQYLFPFYSRDISSGVLSHEQAWELLLNLWVKFMENVGTRIKDTAFQNLTLGGQDEHGRDQSNELSTLCLDATVALQFNQPALSVRWHPNIAAAFWRKAHQTIARGLGMPALFSDSVIIPALIEHGVPLDEARDYGIVGCVEACVPGRMQGVTAGGHLNLAKALELALNEGRSMISGVQIGLPTPAPESFSGFNDLWRAYVTQVEYLAGLDILATVIAGEGQKRRGHCPLMSSLLDDCLTRRRDLVFGGTRYNLPGVGIFGPSNVVDSFSAIQRFVCDEKRLTWGQLRQALLSDFTGHEAMRQELAHGAPRFGNGVRDSDALANKVNAVHAEFFWKHVDSRNGRYTCGVWPVESQVWVGRWTAATPDGRHKGTPIVDGVGACQGADRNGPTALLLSVAQLDSVRHWSAGYVCNVKFSRSCVDSPDDVAKIADLAATFMAMGGQELQFNIVDAATLRAAQAAPDRYADLIVRVAGFSAYFTQLSLPVQEEIISRTEHGL